MKYATLNHMALMILALTGWGHAVASDVEGEGYAFITVQQGGHATSDVGGKAFPDALTRFARRTSGIKAGKTVATDGSTTADLALPAYQMAVRLGPGSRLLIRELPDVDSGQPVSLLLLDGTISVISRSGADLELRLAAGEGDRAGTLRSKGAAVSAKIDEDGIQFGVAVGVAYFKHGDAPGEPLDEGKKVSAGEQIEVVADAKPTSGHPETLTGLMATGQVDQVSYQFGLQAGERWIADAERGDLTPVRTPGGARPSVLPEAGLSPELAFDQARAGGVVQAPRTVRTAARTQGTNPIRSLLSSGLPSEVVVGRRIVTARFLGIRGGIRINPNFDPLIKLAGRPGR